jgi:Arrestin (or S-antigen), C-terminal domain
LVQTLENGMIVFSPNFSCALDRAAFCSGETLKLKTVIDNQGEENVRLKARMVQHTEFFVERGVLGVTKENECLVFEHKGEVVGTNEKQDTCTNLKIPTLPPTMMAVCRLVQIYYTLTASLEFEKSGDDLQINFPITIATVPFRIPNSNLQPILGYGEIIIYRNYMCCFAKLWLLGLLTYTFLVYRCSCICEKDFVWNNLFLEMRIVKRENLLT